jgi:hypothetical protein
MRSPYRTALFASLLASCAPGVLWAAYDWFQGRYLRAFSEHTAVFSGDPLRLPDDLAGPAPIRLVHFWDPACPCNVGNQQHLTELVEQYAAKASSSTPCKSPAATASCPHLEQPENHHRPARPDQIPASPAVAIWDRSGKLAYFGPYSEGLTCNSSNSFIEPILKALTPAAR